MESGEKEKGRKANADDSARSDADKEEKDERTMAKATKNTGQIPPTRKSIMKMEMEMNRIMEDVLAVQGSYRPKGKGKKKGGGKFPFGKRT